MLRLTHHPSVVGFGLLRLPSPDCLCLPARASQPPKLPIKHDILTHSITFSAFDHESLRPVRRPSVFVCAIQPSARPSLLG
jgi:hypothetical protein